VFKAVQGQTTLEKGLLLSNYFPELPFLRLFRRLRRYSAGMVTKGYWTREPGSHATTVALNPCLLATMMRTRPEGEGQVIEDNQYPGVRNRK
jgi:hypothetical protein